MRTPNKTLGPGRVYRKLRAMSDAVQELVIEGWVPTQIANGSRQRHWTTRRAIQQADAERTAIAVRQAGWRPATVARPRLEITLIFPQHRRRDADNLYSRCKALVDSLKRLRLFVDDDIGHLDEVILPPLVERGRRATVLRLIG